MSIKENEVKTRNNKIQVEEIKLKFSDKLYFDQLTFEQFTRSLVDRYVYEIFFSKLAKCQLSV